MSKYIKVTRTLGNRTSRDVDLGGNDGYSRRCGLIIELVPVSNVPEPGGPWSCREEELGDGYYVTAQPARSAPHESAPTLFRSYGAMQNSVFVRTLAEAEAYVAKRVKDSTKRYAKQFKWPV